MKHTQGRWDINSSAVKANVFSEKEVTICEVNLIPSIQGKAAPKQEQHANLKLIAAAPEMLEALIESRAFIQRSGITYENADVYNLIDNAIKTAQHETHIRPLGNY